MSVVSLVLLTAVLGALGVLGGGVAVAWWARGRWHEQLRAAGAELGLTFHPGGLFAAATLRGEVDGVPVVIDTVQESDGTDTVTFTRVRATSPSLVGLRAQSSWTTLAGLVVTDVETGDPAFDAAVHVTGPPEVVSSLLSAPVRLAAATLVRDGGEAGADGVSWRQRGEVAGPALVARVRQVVAAAKQLAAPSGAPALLAVATTDPHEAVRARALGRLLAAVGRSPDPAVLAALAERVSDPRVIARVADLRDDVATLRAVLSAGGSGVREAALALARRSAAGVEPQVEAALIALAATPDLAVFRALGAIGTAAAVPALRRHARGFALNGTADAAREAVESIQARIPPALRGAVAVAESTGGELSPPEGAPIQGLRARQGALT